MDVVDDLVAEDERLEGVLAGLAPADWTHPSLAPGWTIADVVLHLALTDEMVVVSAAGTGDAGWRDGDDSVDELAAGQLEAVGALEPSSVFDRWRAAWRASVDALRSADPSRRLGWAAAPLRPATLATTRIAEHWAHALDVTEPLGIDLPDTDRLRHVAWLGHSTLPYAFGLAGLEPAPVRCELAGPSGDTWVFGPADAPSRIVGDAGAFCRVGARRLAPDASGLVAQGPHGAAALGVLRNYAQ